jgi:lipopolysaccharide heptosyltransferase II
MRVLIIRLSAIGDVLFTLPAYRALTAAYPHANIDWLVEDKAHSLLDGQGLARIIVYPRRELALSWRPSSWWRAARALMRHLRTLRATEYDVVLDFQSNLKSSFHASLACGRRKIGYSRGHGKEAHYLFAGELVQPRDGRQHRIAKALDLVSVLGCPPVPRPHLLLSEKLRADARARLRPHRDGGPLIIMHPGTSAFGIFKRWPAERYAQVASELVVRTGARVLVTFGPGEETLADAVLAQVSPSARERVARAPFMPSLLALAATIAQVDLFIGSDSAPLVLASLVNTPSIALFGPKDPDLYGPFAARSEVVRAGVPCSPCTRRQCPDVICMAEIEPASVTERALALLGIAAGTPAHSRGS